VALDRLATAQKPNIRGRSPPSMVRVPSGKMTTDSPFFESPQRFLHSTYSGRLAINRDGIVES
jgi:hypothetical protein